MDDVRIYGYHNNRANDKMVVLGGKACEWYRDFALKDEHHEFKNFMVSLLDYGNQIKITRIDVAIDDFNEESFFTPVQLHKICKKERFAYGKSTFYNIVGDGSKGATLYLKPCIADDCIRIYDKQAERARDSDREQYSPQIRTEIVFRQQKAENFYLAYVYSYKDLLSLFQSYLKEKVNFYSDKDCKVPLKRWQDFLGRVEPFNIPIPKEKVLLFKKFDWIEFG